MKVVFFEKEFNGEKRDFVRIPIADTRDVFESFVRPQDVTNYPKEWSIYKGKANRKLDGTSLKDLPGITEDKRVELEVKGIETIEALATTEKSVLDVMGTVFHELRRIAELHVNAKPKTPKKAAPKADKKEETTEKAE